MGDGKINEILFSKIFELSLIEMIRRKSIFFLSPAWRCKNKRCCLDLGDFKMLTLDKIVEIKNQIQSHSDRVSLNPKNETNV